MKKMIEIIDYLQHPRTVGNIQKMLGHPAFNPNLEALSAKKQIELQNYGIAMTKEQYREVVDKLISPDNFLKDDKHETLSQVYNAMVHISHTLKSTINLFSKIGIDINIEWIGGSLLEFLFDKHENIKKIKFSIHFETKKAAWIDSKNTKCNVNFIQSCGFSFEEAQSIHDFFIKKLRSCESISLRSQDRYSVQVLEEFIENQLLQQGAMTFNLRGIQYDLSMNDKQPSFEEILISCDLVDMPKNYSHLISKFKAPVNFFADIYNHKISVKVDDLNDMEVMTSQQLGYSYKMMAQKINHQLEMLPESSINFHKTFYEKEFNFMYTLSKHRRSPEQIDSNIADFKKILTNDKLNKKLNNNIPVDYPKPLYVETIKFNKI